jgi:hypothetical protein
MTGIHKINLGLALTFALIIMSSSLSFAEGKSVSSINGELALSAGTIGGNDAGVLSASVSFSILNDTGVQFDTMGYERDHDDMQGFGMQVFRRDPEYGMSGAKIYFSKLDHVDVYHAGIQGKANTIRRSRK